MEKILLSPNEVEEVFGLKAGTLANLRSLGRGPKFLKVGRKVLYAKADVERWIRKVSEVKATGEGGK